MKKKSRYGFRYRGVELNPVSECVPDQSLSVQEILRRFTTGTLSPGEIQRDRPYGDDICPDEDEDNMRMEYDLDMDLVDFYQESERVEELKAKVKAQRKKKAAPSAPSAAPSAPSATPSAPSATPPAPETES